MHRSLTLCAGLALVACGGSDKNAPPEGGGTPTEWQTLLTGDWTLPPATEDYVCVRQTVTEDIYVRALQAINPPGTHHTFLTIGPASGPDGVTPCDFTVNHGQAIFGSGVGTNAIEFPPGVAMKMSAGEQLLLNLHLFNSNPSELSGSSGTKMVRVEESEVEYLGENRPALDLSLNIPPHQEWSEVGSTAMSSDRTIFAVLPHMHQLGSHMKVTAASSLDGERVLHDGPYEFEAQLYYPIDPIRMAAGDKLQFECTWKNTTDRTINFGDSSLDEMCAVGLYQYPAER
jgi:copper type II ascorbate-dependent monooxygenase-like protein